MRNGLVNRLVAFLKQDGGHWQEVKIEAGICVGSLAYGTGYLLLLLFDVLSFCPCE